MLKRNVSNVNVLSPGRGKRCSVLQRYYPFFYLFIFKTPFCILICRLCSPTFKYFLSSVGHSEFIWHYVDSIHSLIHCFLDKKFADVVFCLVRTFEVLPKACKFSVKFCCTYSSGIKAIHILEVQYFGFLCRNLPYLKSFTTVIHFLMV